jgi:transglutaminase-like putative cysteine protease
VRTDRYNHETAVRDTMTILQRLARQYAHDPCVIAAVLEACGRLPNESSERDIACAIFHWIRNKIRFVEDESLLYTELGVDPPELDKELLIVPPVLLRMPVPMGDCDDYSLLMASMCLATGIRPYYVTVAADKQDAMKLSHIYVCAYLSDEDSFLPLDAGNRLAVPPGWESDKVTRKAIWTI